MRFGVPLVALLFSLFVSSAWGFEVVGTILPGVGEGGDKWTGASDLSRGAGKRSPSRPRLGARPMAARSVALGANTPDYHTLFGHL